MPGCQNKTVLLPKLDIEEVSGQAKWMFITIYWKTWDLNKKGSTRFICASLQMECQFAIWHTNKMLSNRKGLGQGDPLQNVEERQVD